jgi:hypothetical protein
MFDGPYDPDSVPVELEVEEISHNDETELSPKDLISRSFEPKQRWFSCCWRKEKK